MDALEKEQRPQILPNIEALFEKLNGQPLFNRKSFEEACSQYKEALKRNQKCGDFLLTDAFGKQRKLSYRMHDEEDKYGNCVLAKLILSYNSYQAAVRNSAFMHVVGIVPAYWHEVPIDCSQKKGLDEELCKWRTEWENSTFRQRLITFLLGNLKHSEPVSQVICFGLGSITRDGSRTYVQHLAACDIRDTMQQLQYSEQRLQQVPEPIQLYAQDPDYCSTCTKILDELGFQVVDNPDGFIKVDKNTFVITVAPNVPVKQIITDFLVEEGGPAAMLCNTITTNGFGDADRNITDPSSPKVWRYMERCLTMNCGGEEDAFERCSVYLKPRQKHSA